jgi:poly-gamma-glutamate synthesis protein (capsule biosynthesis protein)
MNIRRSLISNFLFTLSSQQEMRRAMMMTAPPPTISSFSNPNRCLRILILGGDNMLGRAVQLSLPVQADGEEMIMDSCTARQYLDMCLQHPSGHHDDDREHNVPGLEEIRRRNENRGSHLWGDVPPTIRTMEPSPDLLMLNLETAVTKSIYNSDVPYHKGIRYHMHSDNLANVLSGLLELSSPSSPQNDGEGEHPTVFPLIVSFANNHVMDYGRKALDEETLPLLDRIQRENPIQFVGCGPNLQAASSPTIVPSYSLGLRVQVFALSAECAGTPRSWWASAERSGVAGLPGLYSTSDVDAAMEIARPVLMNDKSIGEEDRTSTPSGGDSRLLFRIVSIHWGPNWAGHGEGPGEVVARRALAHRLVDDCGVDLVYGHSSHHVRGMETYRGKLILYGTGDMINDYEGFENPGEERYNRLAAFYIVDIDPDSHTLRQLRIVPMFMNRLRLERFTPASRIWRPQKGELEHNPSKGKQFWRFHQPNVSY